MSRPPPSVRASQADGFAGPAPYRASQGGSLQVPQNANAPMRRSSTYLPGPPSQALSRPASRQSRFEPPPLSATAGPMPGSQERPIAGPKKRLLVTCDGTWLNSDNGLLNGQIAQPSNVSRIGWAIKETSRDGIPQVVHYQAGIGSQGSKLSREIAGAVGMGLRENVRESYSFVAINWRQGDEIFLLGFSRGAYTARSVGGLITEIGLLTRQGLPYFGEIFEDFQHKNDPNYVSKFPNEPFPGKPAFGRQYVQELSKRGLSQLGVPIKAIGVWDTVGSLGVPRIPFLTTLGLQSKSVREYSFYDTSLSENVENAFQALALDEHRSPFSPALWELRDNATTNMKQVWFPGVHSNVGGGYDDQEVSDITLAWMMGRLEPFIDFHGDYLMSAYEANKAYYKQTGQRPRWWSFGEIYNSLTGLYSISGSKTRSPGNYFSTDPATGRITTKRLRRTNEYIHASVRARTGMQGPGPQDRDMYQARPLATWKFGTEPGGAGNMTVWTRPDGEEGQKKIPEAPLSETEIRLLETSPRVADFVRNLGQSAPENRMSGAFGGPPRPPGGAAPRPPGGGRRRGESQGAGPGGGGGGGGDGRRRKRRSHQPRDRG